MAEVFISYKRDQRERVRTIADLLKEEKFSVWFDASLEVGRGEGFDAEIEREVTSAYCVLVCWTQAAIRSVYVRAEAKKGLERDAFVPVLLEECTLPVPFNAIDAVDLTRWHGDKDDPNWRRALSQLREKIEQGKRDEPARMKHSWAAYDRIDDKIYPDTLALLSRRIAALHEMDAAKYHHDIEALLEWVHSITEKERQYQEYGWELANRQLGGGAWRFWDSGAAAARAEEIAKVRTLLTQLDRTLATSQEVLTRPAP